MSETMKRRNVEWLQAPEDEDDDTFRVLRFRVAHDWFAVDSDQLVLPITVLEKTGLNIDEPYTAILKQYGGERLLNDMLLADEQLEKGSTWELRRYQHQLEISPTDADDD